MTACSGHSHRSNLVRLTVHNAVAAMAHIPAVPTRDAGTTGVQQGHL